MNKPTRRQRKEAAKDRRRMKKKENKLVSLYSTPFDLRYG